MNHNVRSVGVAILAIGASILAGASTAHAALPLPMPHSSFVAWKDAPIPATVAPDSVYVAPTGAVWFVDSNAPGAPLSSFDPTSGSTTSYSSTAGGRPLSIAQTGDGQVWFTDPARDNLYRLDPRSNTTVAIPLSAPVHPRNLEVGPGGELWFGTQTPDVIGRVALDGKASLVSFSSSGGEPEDLVWGPDGRLWILQGYTWFVDAYDPVSGSTAHYPLSTNRSGEIEAGPDGAVYLAAVEQVLRISVTGIESVLPIPDLAGWPVLAMRLEGGARGLFMTDNLGRILSVAPDGRFTPSPEHGEYPSVDSLAIAPDGYLWYTDGVNQTLVFG